MIGTILFDSRNIPITEKINAAALAFCRLYDHYPEWILIPESQVPAGAVVTDAPFRASRRISENTLWAVCDPCKISQDENIEAQ